MRTTNLLYVFVVALLCGACANQGGSASNRPVFEPSQSSRAVTFNEENYASPEERYEYYLY